MKLIDNKQKLAALKDNLNTISKKIADLSVKKKKLEKQISDIEQKEFMSIIRQNDCTVVTLSDDLELIKRIKASNISQNELLELLNDLGLNDLGGQNDEQKEV